MEVVRERQKLSFEFPARKQGEGKLIEGFNRSEDNQTERQGNSALNFLNLPSINLRDSKRTSREMSLFSGSSNASRARMTHAYNKKGKHILKNNDYGAKVTSREIDLKMPTKNIKVI